MVVTSDLLLCELEIIHSTTLYVCFAHISVVVVDLKRQVVEVLKAASLKPPFLSFDDERLSCSIVDNGLPR